MKIFFDLDGTLVDISLRHYTVYRNCVAKFGGEQLDKTTYWDEKRKNTKWASLLKMSSIDKSLENDFLAVFIDLIEQPNNLVLDTLFAKSKEILEQLGKDNDIYLVSLRRSHKNLIVIRFKGHCSRRQK
jgi:phosphoglycolate phosphatase-like HAD superfamily hydrolase